MPPIRTDATTQPAIQLLTRRFCNRLYDVEIRRVICSTNSIESLNARYRRAIKARGHFPSEQAAMKCLYLVTRSLDPPAWAGHDG
jgi:transposase-like protein